MQSPHSKKRDSFEYNCPKMHDRPDSIVVSHDLLSLCWHFAWYCNCMEKLVCIIFLCFVNDVKIDVK